MRNLALLISLTSVHMGFIHFKVGVSQFTSFRTVLTSTRFSAIGVPYYFLLKPIQYLEKSHVGARHLTPGRISRLPPGQVCL